MAADEPETALERLTRPGVPRCLPCQIAEAMGEQTAGARLQELGAQLVALERQVARLKGHRTQHDDAPALPAADPDEVSLREELASERTARRAAEADVAHLRFQVKQLREQNAALKQRRPA